MNRYYFSYLILFCLLFISCNSHETPTSSSPFQKDSLDLKNLTQRIEDKIEKNENELAYKHGIQLKELAYKTENKFFQGKAHAVLGYLNLIQDHYDSAYYHYNEAKEIFLEVKDSVNLAKVMINMSMIQSNQGDYAGSEAVATEALQYVPNSNQNGFLNALYNNLAICSNEQHNYQEAIYWFEKALESTQDPQVRSVYRNNMGVSYRYLKDFDKSISILSELQKDSILSSNLNLKAKVMDNLAFAQWEATGDRSLGKPLLDALALREEIGDKYGKISSHYHLVQFYRKHSPSQALSHAQKMLKISEELNSQSDRLKALKVLIELENSDKAKEYAIQFTSLQDSLLKAQNLIKDKFAKIRFDTEKNREENQYLRAETAEQKLEIEKRKNYLTALGFILLLGAIITWAYQRIQKMKHQKKITEEIHKTEAKISQKVHDELSNNIYQLMTHFQFGDWEKNKSEFLEKLEEIYKLSRDISRENQPIEIDENYPDEILQLVATYKNQQTNIILSGFEGVNWMKINPEIKIQFYKTLQELLTNMKKHSQASLVVLSFKFEKNKLDFLYSDNGIGIQKNEFISKNGMQITENRIAKINGAISFVSDQSRGLKVNISIPI